MSAGPTGITPTELEKCTRILEAIAGDSLVLSQLSHEDRIRFLVAAGQVIRPEKEEVRRRLRAQRRARREAKRAGDRALRAATTIRVGRKDSVYVPAPRIVDVPAELSALELKTPQACYICKGLYTKLHHFYDSMCPSCAEFNYAKRFQAQSMPGVLKGTVALITGARLKIGYQAALTMLQSGARVIVTTRFPKDAAMRFGREPDFREWRERFEVHGLDLRHSPSVEAFAQFIADTHERLDFLINNAAQTVRRPPGFYAHLLEGERRPFEELPSEIQALLEPHERFKRRLEGVTASHQEAEDGTRWIGEWHRQRQSALPGVTNAAELSQIPYACDAGGADPEKFPAGRLDADLQQVDLRSMNSWRMTLDHVSTAELLEVQLVNSIAPFVLCGKLKPLMIRTPGQAKHVVNVSAMEGKFSRHTKTDKHPHTNMAKAALNMMTLTSARDYVRFGIYMNAVDTGWVTDEDPAQLSARKEQDHDFQPPLDIVDGAARVLDPIFSGLQTGKHSWGNFLKDYVPTEW
jgi:NAD(P)-dependent dehydrogenase (short-subunit alcohol dehydrogenase family)